MLPTPEITQEILDAPASCDASQQIKAIAALTIQAIENIIEAEESNQIDAEIADEAIEDILANQIELQSIALGIELEDIEEELEQIAIVGSPAEDFGTALTALIASEADSMQEGAMMVSDQTGIDPDTLWDYCNNRAMPSQEEAMAIGSCFQCCHDDPSAMEHLISLADDGMADYSKAQNQLTAEFAAIRSERESMEHQANIQHRLKGVERIADQLYADRRITPEQRRRIMPMDIAPDERANFSAFFSATAQKLGTTPDRYLDNIEFTLNFLAEGAQIDPILMSDFGSYVEQHPEPLDRTESIALDSYRASYGFG